METNRVLTRFMRYVQTGDGCWEWTGAALPRGTQQTDLLAGAEAALA